MQQIALSFGKTLQLPADLPAASGNHSLRTQAHKTSPQPDRSNQGPTQLCQRHRTPHDELDTLLVKSAALCSASLRDAGKQPVQLSQRLR